MFVLFLDDVYPSKKVTENNKNCKMTFVFFLIFCIGNSNKYSENCTNKGKTSSTYKTHVPLHQHHNNTIDI